MKRIADLVVVERGGSIAGAYAAKVLADLGASVVTTGRDELTDHQRAYLRTDVDRVDGPVPVDVDVAIESSALDPLPPPPLSPPSPGTVLVRISPFGSTGPYAGRRGSDLTDQALGGHVHLYGDPRREPLRGPANQPAYAAGLFGAVGALVALFDRRRRGRGAVVEVDHHTVMVALHQFTLLRHLMTGDVLTRMGNRYTGLGEPNGIYRCADGWVAIAAPTEQMVENLLAITELTHLLDHPDITTALDFQLHPAVLHDSLGPWLAARPVAEVVDLFQAVRVPACPSSSLDQLLEDPQLAAREQWRTVNGIRLPKPPVRFGPPQAGGGRRLGPTDDVGGGPLAGLRVLDLTRVWAGPLCTRTLADFGADVVRIEAPWARGPRRVPEAAVVASQLFPGNDPGDTPWNRNAHEIKYAIGKRSVVLDLATDAGVDTLRRLVPSFDVVIENYSPRVMPDMGMDESEIHRLNPDAVYVTMPGYGRDGPARDWLAYGSSVDSHAGLSTLIGYPDQHPWKGGIAWPDPVAGLHAAAGLLAAVWDREADPGRGGVTLESAQFEATVAVVGDRLVEAQIDGEPGPQWNRDHEGRFVAQGIYPCAGVDRWVAASVPSDAWPALCRLVGLDPATADDHAAVDAAMAAWTAQLDQRDAEARLQAVGVAAGAVLDAPGVLADPQLAAADAFVTVDQPEVGPFLVPRTPIRLDGRVTSVAGPAPGLGQHHHDVLTADAGLTPTDIAALVEAGVVATEPPA